MPSGVPLNAMEANTRKLPKAKAAFLTSFPIDAAEPYRPLPAPVYLLLSRNGKMVSVKGAFDFFTDGDLDRFRAGGNLFYGPVFQKAERFQALARSVRKTLGWGMPNATDVLEPTPFEISDAILRKLGEAWAPIDSIGEEGSDSPYGIDSHFAVTFANELCDPIPGEWLESSREEDPDRYETALVRAGVFVFLALHLGYQDSERLSAYRLRFFREMVSPPDIAADDYFPYSIELTELKRWTEAVVTSSESQLISSTHFEGASERAIRKLKKRLDRVRECLVAPDARLERAAPTEKGGEADVG